MTVDNKKADREDVKSRKIPGCTRPYTDVLPAKHLLIVRAVSAAGAKRSQSAFLFDIVRRSAARNPDRRCGSVADPIRDDR